MTADPRVNAEACAWTAGFNLDVRVSVDEGSVPPFNGAGSVVVAEHA
jgi:hypothetical protein